MAAAGRPVILINPRLGNSPLLNEFESAYLLRPLSFGYMEDQYATQVKRVGACVLRCYPHEYNVFFDGGSGGLAATSAAARARWGPGPGPRCRASRRRFLSCVGSLCSWGCASWPRAAPGSVCRFCYGDAPTPRSTGGRRALIPRGETLAQRPSVPALRAAGANCSIGPLWMALSEPARPPRTYGSPGV